MGVSGSSDLDLIINGGEAFVNRLAELRAATEAYTKSLNDLNLGKAAVAARDEAGRALSEANSQREIAMAALDKEITQARESLNAWVEETRAKTLAANNEKNQALAEARTKQEAASAANDAAQKILVKAKAEAVTLVKDANAEAADIVDRATKEAASILAKARATEYAASKALADAEAAKAKYDTAMDRIKSAAVS